MVDKKVTEFTEDASPTTDDLVPTINDPAGTPVNRKVTLANVFTLFKSLANTFAEYQTFTKGTRNGVSAITSSATIELDFDAGEMQTLALDHNTTFSTSNRVAGAKKKIKIVGTTSTRTMAFPAWKWADSVTVPADIAVGVIAYLVLDCWGTAETDVYASYEIFAAA